MRRLQPTFRGGLAVVAVCASLHLCGCVQPPDRPKPPPPVAEVHEITMISEQAPAYLDSQPGPDGVRVQVLMFRVDKTQPNTVSGTLDMIVYNGSYSASELGKVEPWHVWTMSGDELRRYIFRLYSLWGYTFTLTWGDTPPSGGPQRRITLRARYTSPGGVEIYSEPTFVQMPDTGAADPERPLPGQGS